MYSAYKLNKHSDSIQPWCTPFLIWNQSVVPCPTLTVASWPAYRFLKRQVRWSGIPSSLRIFHSLLWSTRSKALVSEAEVDVFLKFSCFFYNPTDVGNLISGSSAFSKSSLNIWRFFTLGLCKVNLYAAVLSYLSCFHGSGPPHFSRCHSVVRSLRLVTLAVPLVHFLPAPPPTASNHGLRHLPRQGFFFFFQMFFPAASPSRTTLLNI